MKKLMRFFKEEDGATAVEYALMVALIAGAIVGAVTFLGTGASARFQAAATQINP